MFVSRFFLAEGGERDETLCVRDGRERKGRSVRRPKDGARQNMNAFVCLVPSSLAFSASRSLSPSPDKSETEVVGIAKSPHRVQQTKPVMRQYSSIFYLSLSRYYLCPSLFSGQFAVIHSSLFDGKIVIGEMRQQRDSTLDTSRQLCLSCIYRLVWS